jgi:hypothetical protein
MPIVFVHGVNNRGGVAYQKTEISRSAFLREIVAPALGIAPVDVHISSPYWGDKGARFAWGMAVLPSPDEPFEAFGGIQEATATGGLETAFTNSAVSAPGGLLDYARRDFAAVVDVLYASAMASTTTEEQAREVAHSYLIVSEYAENNLSPAWLPNALETNFIDQLDFHANTGREESFGAGGIVDLLKEGLSRILNVLPSFGTSAGVIFARKQLNGVVTNFAGDAFTYLARRGTKDLPGDIVTTVLNSLREAAAQKTKTDDRLVVIAHSFGGEIVYDIVTHFDTHLEIDWLITVGSQVGLFEELKLYIESKATLPPDPPKGRIARPAGLKRWLNVFDLNDVLSYLVEPVFEGAADFHYDTGYGALSAHGGYFMRPSFYKRLAERLRAG